MSTLVYLNELRKHTGKAPLKAWKESKAKLAEAIAKLEANISALEPDRIVAPGIGSPDEVVTVIKAKGTPIPKKPETPVVELVTITLVEIAKELSINPRVARAKMRRVKSLPEGTVVGKHTYARTHKQHVIDALKHDFRKR
jgi:hypothetical protein